MRLLHIVLLFSYYFIGSANQASTDEADCDDQNVFQAADEVLRSFNDAKQDGNQFVLYRITEATKKEETGKVHIFIKFKIQESVCQVKNGVYWQRCAFKVNEAVYGECSAHVVVNIESKSREIIFQNCSITKEPTVTAVLRSCLGCSYVIDPNNEQLIPILQSAIEKMNRVGNHQFYFELENVTKAEQQVVSGWNYKLEYNIRETNCSKSLFPKWTPEKCSLAKNGHGGSCITNVFVTPHEEIRDINLNCQSSTGFCLSCPDQVESNDPEVLNLLNQFIEKYNSRSNHTSLYKFQNERPASRKLVQNEKQYIVDFSIKETNCSKSDHSVLGEECAIKPLGDTLFCQANINVADQTVNILPDYKCSKFQTDPRIAIKGLSPLRMMPSLVRSQRRISRSSEKLKRNGPDHKEQKHEKKQIKDKKDKGDKKHNGKHGHSSEESAEEHRIKPQVPSRPTQQAIPRVPEIHTSVLVTTNQQANPTNADKVHGPPLTQPSTPSPTPFIPNLLHPVLPAVPNIHETVILELPVLAPEEGPKCPGKLWQPLLPILQITTDKPFIIEGLTFDDNDLLPE